MTLPAEFAGLARDFRRRVRAADAAAAEAIADALAPIYRGCAGRVALRREWVSGAVRAWRMNVPRFGRLSFDATIRGTRASIAEVRVMTGRLIDERWHRAEWEDGITLCTISAELAARPQWAQRTTLTISQHALGRRYERGERSDDAVIADLAALAPYRAADFPLGPFTLRAGSGLWCGQQCTLQNGSASALSIRTYFHAEQRAELAPA